VQCPVHSRSVLSLLCFADLTGGSLAEVALSPVEVDKQQFTLLHKTPRPLLREMSTDRPDKTESAYTVDAGHFQLEMDIGTYTVDRHDSEPGDLEAQTLGLALLNLKVGLLNNLDLQLIIPVYNRTRLRDRASDEVHEEHGFGDLALRTKLNIWGNDNGATALAVMPFLGFPTGARLLGSGAVEGGLIVPFAAALPLDWSLGLMGELDLRRDGSGSGHHAEFIHTITFGHEIYRKLGGYVEFFSLLSSEGGSNWIGTVDLGLTLRLTEDIQIDAGVNIGVTRSADDFNPFLGLAVRF
jgi:hypothetical protein